MARRKELGNIANGLLGSFNSRNNDLSGYWGIGLLRLFAQQEHSDTFTINLLNSEVTPPNDKVACLAVTYNNMLNVMLQRRGISSSWISSAMLKVSFNQPYEKEYHFWRSALGGTPYVCTFEIIDDLGKSHQAKFGCNCWPHDSNKERRRAGAASVARM